MKPDIDRRVRMLVWNVAWNDRRARLAPKMAEIIDRADPDLICLTEAHSGFIDARRYHVVEADPDYGYGLSDKRKVIIASKSPWSRIDRADLTDLPSGRFVSGLTETSIGALRITGLCIPWSSAHVTSGRRDRRAWEDHRAFLANLRDALPKAGDAIVMGDFNQTVPRTRAPVDVYPALLDALEGYSIATRDLVGADDHPLIDHLAIRGRLAVSEISHISRNAPDGSTLSDHSGFVADIASI